MAVYWKIAAHSAYVMFSWYKYLTKTISHPSVFRETSHSFFLIAPFPGHCLLVIFDTMLGFNVAETTSLHSFEAKCAYPEKVFSVQCSGLPSGLLSSFSLSSLIANLVMWSLDETRIQKSNREVAIFCAYHVCIHSKIKRSLNSS